MKKEVNRLKQMIYWIKMHPYSLWLLYYIPYLICFMLFEHFMTPKIIIHSDWDNMIPFNEYFIVPYLVWFPFMFGSLLYFLFKNKRYFQDLCFFMFLGMSISLLIYFIVPNGIDLRVDFTVDNVFAWMVNFIQGVDDSANVCPSIHVASTFAIMLVILRYPYFKHRLLINAGSACIGISIILSTMFLKQHSVIDVIAGLLLSLVLYYVTFHTNWRRIFYSTKLHFLAD